MSNRLNDERSAIVVIMQRLHDADVSGDILRREANYCHMLIPMYFDPLRYPASADGTATEDPETGEPFEGNEIGWIDPRALDEDGEVLSPQGLAERENMLAWPKRVQIILLSVFMEALLLVVPADRDRRHHSARRYPRSFPACGGIRGRRPVPAGDRSRAGHAAGLHPEPARSLDGGPDVHPHAQVAALVLRQAR
jgi:hypothetical protein